MDSKALFSFAPDITGAAPKPVEQQPVWKILSVDDDQSYQKTLVYALSNLTVADRPIHLLTAGSASEAAMVIASHPELSVILLDVVMEDDNAGLRLVDTVRSVLGNSAIRIVLLTGQPGMAPLTDVMKRYDINEYWCKSELKSEKLISIVASNVRTWIYISQLIEAKQGLQMLVDASQSLTNKRDINIFTQTVLTEIGKIVGVTSGGIVCFRQGESCEKDDFEVLAASGRYEHLTGAGLKEMHKPDLLNAFLACTQNKAHYFGADFTILYFDTKHVDNCIFLTMVENAKALPDAHINLLRVFSENITTGFTNVALYNRLTELAYYDPLLAIPNRNWFLRELGNMSEKERALSHLMLFDVDDFTDMGVELGDEYCNNILKCLHRNLVRLMPQAFAFARVGSDEFGVLMTSSGPLTLDIVRQLSNQIAEFDGVEHAFSVTFSEMSLSAMLDAEPSQMLRLAECAIDTARRDHTSHLVYTSALSENLSNRFSLLNQLREGLLRHEFYIALQPKVNLDTRAVVSFEALARWRNAAGEMIPPDRFIPVAEASGLIGSLDRTIFLLASQALKELKLAGYELPIAFNVSCIELLHQDFLSFVQREIATQGISPKLLEMEITESQTMGDAQNLWPQLRDILATGMKISIDDFGTGYSSLSQVANLPATTLKIDREFVKQLGESDNGRHIVDMILRLGERFNYEIVAEGIETEQQCSWLKQMGCRIGQGFLFAKPMTLKELLEWLPAPAE